MRRTLMVLVGAAALLRGEASVRQEGETIFAGNGEVELRFHRPSGRWTGLIDVASGYDFVVVPNYWGTPFNLAVRVDGQMEYPSAGSASTSSFESERTGTGLLLRFGYSGFRMVSGRVLDMGVRYTVEIPDAGLLTYWRISVDNREELPVESVGFPTIVGLGAIGADPRQEYLAYPIMSGTLYRDPLHNLPVGRGVLAQYPSSFATMQFAAYYSAERKLGLYLAAYDTDAYIKELQILKPSEEYLLATCFRALEQGPRNSYESSYPVVVGPFRGEWFDAYREWALQQEWVKKEPAPEWFPKVNIYQWLYTLPFGYDAKPFRVVPDVAKDTAAQMGSPSAITWIGWERVGWYSYWPDVFPPKEGWESFDRSVAGTHEAGDRIFLIADVGGQSSVASNWEEAKPWAVRQPDGSLALWPYSEATARETATISTTFATMCPATAYWQAKLGEVLGTLAAHGADIVQLDGFPVNQPLLCMDASHGHPLGGGNWWTKGYLDAFRRAKSAAGEAGTPLLYSAEGVAEPYLPVLDSYWDPFTTGRPAVTTAEYRKPEDAELIPLWNTVYHEYAVAQAGLTQYAGTNKALRNPPYFVRGMGLALVWGEAPVTWHPDKLMSAQTDTAVRGRIEYLRRIVEARSTFGERFLVHGRMLRPLKLDVPSFEIGETDPIPYTASKYPAFQAPAVLGSAWQATDGDFGVVATNISAERVSFNLPFDSVLEGGVNEYSMTLYWNGTKYGPMELGATYLPLELGPQDVVLVALSRDRLGGRPD